MVGWREGEIERVMALLYRMTCKECGRGPGTDPGVPPPAGEIPFISEGHFELLTPDGRFVVLGHPLESRILADHGYTWKTASAEERVYRVESRVCLDCGRLSEIRSLHVAGPTCAMLLLVPMLAVAGSMIAGRPALQSAAVMAIAFVAVQLVYAIMQLRRRENSAPVSLACPNCGGITLPPSELSRAKLPCVHCGAKAVICEPGAIS